MEKKKFFINEEGVIEVTPFFDKQVKKYGDFIELTFEEWQEKLSDCTYGNKKVYKDGEIIEVEDERTKSSKEYKELQTLIEIQQCKEYLASTDYVISKLNEAKIESEEEYQNLKEKYQETLVKRAEARKRINELGG
jgi:hypothetical protein